MTAKHRPILTTEWRREPPDYDAIDRLAFDAMLPASIAEICVNRGLTTSELLDDFGSKSLKKLHNPTLLPDIRLAIDRIKLAISRNEMIYVCGDYDVDGVTSTAVIVKGLKMVGANFDYHVPHRVNDGYDIKPASIDRAIEAGATLVISVDCGILAFATAEYAKSKGVDLIITDHHTPKETGEVPDCVAVVNPRRVGSEYPFHDLAGVGIAFKVMIQLVKEMGMRWQDYFVDTIEYVALGTVADVASMTDENRVLVSLGCTRLSDSNKVGIKELLKVAGIKNGVSTMAIGFQLGPRINAIGRLGASRTALDLLLTDDPREATTLAAKLDSMNKVRQKRQEEWTEEAAALVEMECKDNQVIVIAASNWHPGLVGLIASKLVEQFGKPAIVGAIKEDGVTIKGSCRSTPHFHILNAMRSDGCAPYFSKFGGHAFAAGYEMNVADIPKLRVAMDEYTTTAANTNDFGKRIIEISSILQPEEINEKTYQALGRLAPFGNDNPEPIFATYKLTIVSMTTMTQDKHLKLKLQGGDKTFSALGWRKGGLIKHFKEGDLVDIAYKISFEEYQGRQSIQVTLEDIRPSQSGSIREVDSEIE
jgi:single-stranded-DNA-specific exonuclease